MLQHRPKESLSVRTTVIAVNIGSAKAESCQTKIVTYTAAEPLRANRSESKYFHRRGASDGAPGAR